VAQSTGKVSRTRHCDRHHTSLRSKRSAEKQSTLAQGPHHHPTPHTPHPTRHTPHATRHYDRNEVKRSNPYWHKARTITPRAHVIAIEPKCTYNVIAIDTTRHCDRNEVQRSNPYWHKARTVTPSPHTSLRSKRSVEKQSTLPQRPHHHTTHHTPHTTRHCDRNEVQRSNPCCHKARAITKNKR